MITRTERRVRASLLRLAVFTLVVGAGTTISAQPVPSYTSERSNAPKGFYSGVVLMSGFGGSAEFSGTLMDHEKEVNRELVANNMLGSSLLQLAGGLAGMPQLPSQFITDPRFSGGHNSFFELEYGLFSHLGVGITLATGGLHVERQEQFPLWQQLSQGPTTSIPFYTEVFPISRTYYRENLVMGLLTFHPLTNNRFDPYLGLRAGVGTVQVAYRRLNSPFQNLIQPDVAGRAMAGGVMLGMNLNLTNEFGIKLEMSAMRRVLRSEIFDLESLNSGTFSAGFFLNWDNIDRYSY